MNNNGKRSIICAALALPLALVFSNIVSWYFKSNNPDNVDITAGLAYLRPILVTGFVTFGVVMGVGLISALAGRKKDASAELSKLGLMLVVVITILSLVAGIASKVTSTAQDNYREQKAREYFNQVR